MSGFVGPGHAGPSVRIGAVTVLESIDRVVKRKPDTLAVVASDGRATYAELDFRADTAASGLSRRGVGRGDVVLIAAEAGVDFTAAVLGALRVGAAYLPVDLSYPADRIAAIASTASASIRVDAGEEVDAGAVRLRDLVSGAPEPYLRPELTGEDTSYLIVTSGSTGAPKGIVQTHRCLANFVSWQVEASGLGRDRRVLQAAPLSFDVSVQELFYTLASGGTLYVPPRAVRRDPRALVRFVIDNDIEVIDLPQSMIDAMMAAPTSLANAPSLRHVISAGETVRVSPELAELLRDRPELSLHNHYGPAENHMVCSHSMSDRLGNVEADPPVGALVWNTYIRILDGERRAVPDGEVGEVYIGGVGVGRYTDPELTGLLFLDDPFATGHRLYRTRDRGRWRSDGTLQLLGRIDDLLKIRGNSVEPREVEAHLSTLDGIRGAAVYGVRGADGAIALHAVIVGDPPPVPRLRAILLAVLPDYMVPVKWWTVAALPMSPNGKLDRRALPGVDPIPVPMRR
ncbi:amino acid adenylation domain-containing protein [Stackebrandtia soli]|uniref:amino acid adenylation domain-containing protein n=1 Tax=Stackebrandtia soli TaxID=1892856 RepID=UPI0039E98CDE